MPIKKAVKLIFTRGCVLFTILSVIVYSAAAITSGKIKGLIPSLDLILMLLIFSFAVIAASLILTECTFPLAARLLIHFLVLGAVYYFLFVLWAGIASNGAQTMIALALYILLYGISIAVWSAIRAARKKKENSEKEYTSIFSSRR